MHGLRQSGSRSGKHPDLPEYIATYRTQKKASRWDDLCRKLWTNLSRIRTVVGRYRSSLNKLGLTGSASCECCEIEQTVVHIINSYPLYRSPHETELFEVGPQATPWLFNVSGSGFKNQHFKLCDSHSKGTLAQYKHDY